MQIPQQRGEEQLGRPVVWSVLLQGAVEEWQALWAEHRLVFKDMLWQCKLKQLRPSSCSKIEPTTMPVADQWGAGCPCVAIALQGHRLQLPSCSAECQQWLSRLGD